MSILIGNLIIVIVISIVGIIMLILEIHSYADVIDHIQKEVESLTAENRKLKTMYDNKFRESSSWESQYKSQLYISNKLSKNIDVLNDKLKYFENRFNTNEVYSRVF